MGEGKEGVLEIGWQITKDAFVTAAAPIADGASGRNDFFLRRSRASTTPLLIGSVSSHTNIYVCVYNYKNNDKSRR